MGRYTTPYISGRCPFHSLTRGSKAERCPESPDLRYSIFELHIATLR